MIIPQTESITSTLRQLCSEIQSKINKLLQSTTGIFQVQVEKHSIKTHREANQLQFQRIMEQLKSGLVQTVTARLPKIISCQQNLKDKIEDLQQERDQWKEKYKKVYQSYENNQLENDKIKIQIVAISENYEDLSINFEKMKFKYLELKQKEFEIDKHKQQNDYLEKLKEINLIGKDSVSNSASGGENDSERDNMKTQHEVMCFEKQLFLEEIRLSKKEIISFRQTTEELLRQKAHLEKENEELDHLLQGEKARSDKLDREILDLLNKNQEIKLESLEIKEKYFILQKQNQIIEEHLEVEKRAILEVKQQKQDLNKQLIQQEFMITQLKKQNSQTRQKYKQLQDKQLNFKEKINQLQGLNKQLNILHQNVAHKLSEASEKLEKIRYEESLKHKHQIQLLRQKSNHNEKECKFRSGEKINQISKMHKQITQKLEQKIVLLEKGSKEKKGKISELKYQVERLYESLQSQVQKQFKNTQKIKDLTQKLKEFEKYSKNIEEKLKQAEKENENLKQSLKESMFSFHSTERKLKNVSEVNNKLSRLVLPKLKEQLHSTKLICEHFAKMIQMQKQQMSFLLQNKQEHLKNIIEQICLQKSICNQQLALNHSNEIAKWKQNCKNYQQKYDQLKNNHQYISAKLQKLEHNHVEQIQNKVIVIKQLKSEIEKQKLDQMGTLKTIDILKQKCQQVEQYYQLVQDLSKENIGLKNKLQTSYFSFKSPDRVEFDNTSKRPRFTQQNIQKYSKTANIGKYRSKNEDYNLNDLTTKAEFQKVRLQAAKRQYNLINRYQHQ